MNTEFEAKFLAIDKTIIRQKLAAIGAKLTKVEFLQKRVVFDLPTSQSQPGRWVRVRDEGDKITMSYKAIEGNDSIEQQTEIQLIINDFQAAVELLEKVGCQQRAYQENYRELWVLNEKIEITIDSWPFLDTFLEIEGSNEEQVKETAGLLELNYQDGIFSAVDYLYGLKYNIDPKTVYQDHPLLTFGLERNPFNNGN